MSSISIVFVVGCVLSAMPAETASTLASKLEADISVGFSEKPITKVVNLLKDMQSQLEKEMKQDIELYDAMQCWCTENDKAKTQAIKDAEVRLADLESAIEEMTAKSAQLKTDIETLTEEISENEKTLKDASAIRSADNAVFVDEEKDSVQMVDGLNGAVQSLGKHHETPGAELADEQMEKSASFLQQSSLRQPVAAKSYDSQSGAIFGILRTMKEEGEVQLETMQKQEETASAAHQNLSKSKTEELTAAREQLGEKRQELADTDESLATAKSDQRDTKAQFEADTVFLADLKARCGSMDEQWAVRKKMRTEETTAVSDAIAILADDDAKDVARKTVGSSFAQTSMVSGRSQNARERAALILQRSLSSVREPSLEKLLIMLQTGDVFAKIKQAITEMVAQLKEEHKEEVKQMDYCKEELHKNEMELTAGYESREDLEGKLEDLEGLIKDLGERVEDTKGQIATTQIELKKAAENRGKENLEFQMTISDQRQMQAVLQKALDKLKAFYDKKAGVTLLQKQAPPAEFKPYKPAGGAGGVVGFIMNIIGESQKTEKEAKIAEQEAQQTYEEFVATSNALLKTLDKALADMAAQKANADQDTVVTKEELGNTLKNLMSLSEMSSELHGECDYVVENFSARQKARTAEIEGLQQAHQVLSGASFK